MRSFVVALALVSVLAAGCSDDDGGSSGSSVDVDTEVAKEYLAELDTAGLGDIFDDDEQAVAYVATACDDAEVVGQTPEALIESGAVSAQAAIALGYCDTDLNV
jgi:hypothetical protein